MTWDGEEKRMNDRDHDVLTRIDANLSNFMKRFDDHAADDTKNFKSLDDRTGKIEDRTRQIEKRFWIAYGIGIALIGFVKIVFK